MVELPRTTALPPRADSTPAALAERLVQVIRGYGRVAVALSAGVDSSVVARAAALACGENALAVTAVSPSLAEGELAAAQDFAAAIGLRHVVLRTEEFDDPRYAANPADRCYFCKRELYTRMATLATELGVDTLVNGANLDDCGDHRPGMLAAREHRVKSPLIEAGLTKPNVRELARYWGLPVWNKPAAPCLSSRIAYGVAVTPERVRRIDAAERWLRGRLPVRELRVRLDEQDVARIELPLADLGFLVDPAVREEAVGYLKSLGFTRVTLDLAGFRSGSQNDRLAPADLVRLETAWEHS